MFIVSFHSYILQIRSAYNVPGTVVGAREIVVNKPFLKLRWILSKVFWEL